MTKKERAQIEKRLLEERARALRTLRVVQSEEGTPPTESAGDVSHWPTHLADEASETEEQERDFMVASREADLLHRIDAALRLLRSDPKTFDKCESCGRPIELERFDVLPWTRLCAACARQEESR